MRFLLTCSLVALLPVGDIRRIGRVAHDLQVALAMPIVIDGNRVPVPARLGVAVAPPDEDADATLSRAEAAADAATERALPSVIYDGGLNDFSRVQLELLADASTAIHRGDVHAFYQPQVDLRNGECIGLEALVRWHHPTHGDIPPSLFVPLAERMGLMNEVGEFMLTTACNDLARLRSDGAMTNGRVSVMAGGGIGHRDAPTIVERTGVREIHVGLSSSVTSPMRYRNPKVSISRATGREYERGQVLEEDVRTLQRALSLVHRSQPDRGR